MATIKKHNPGALRTHILYESNLSYSLLSKYLGYLVDNGMMTARRVNRELVHCIADKAKELLKAYEKLRLHS